MTPTALAAALALSLGSLSAQAATFETDWFKGSFDSSVSTGLGARLQAPSPSLIQAGNTGGPAGQASGLSGLGDQGDLNYGKGDLFTQYLKGTHELVLKFPSEVTFMARGSWLGDAAATHTTGWESVASSAANPGFNSNGYHDGLADDARSDLRFKARMLDLWVSKTFSVGEQQARVRVGQQVINWGESLFAPGGINATNPVDIMRLSQPGTQLKEAILPTPAISLASGLGGGLNVETYVQTAWKPSYQPPTGSYWSMVNGMGKGEANYGLSEQRPGNGGQWGLALKYRPASTSLDLGLYAVSYHDKTAQLNFNMVDVGGGTMVPVPYFSYAPDRKLLGLSANFPVGDWAVGTELSYRPKEAVALNANTTLCASQSGRCYVDEKKFQWHLVGSYMMSPANSPDWLKALGADSALLLTELVVMHFPGLQQTYGGIDPVAAGGWGWGNETSLAGTPVPVGTKTSAGLAVDYSWTYDGSLLPGWQVTPEIFYSRALTGRTPTLAANYMSGAQSANLTITFARNPATWQLGVNIAKFWGGHSVFDQPYADRSFVGAYATYNF